MFIIHQWKFESLRPRGPNIKIFMLILQVLNYETLLFAINLLRGVKKCEKWSKSVNFGVFGVVKGGG